MTALELLLAVRDRLPDARGSLTLADGADALVLGLCYRQDPPERRFMSIGIDDTDWTRATDDVMDEIVDHETRRRRAL